VTHRPISYNSEFFITLIGFSEIFVVYLTTLSQYLRLYSVEWKCGKWMINWKGCWRKRSWPSLMCCLSVCLEGLRKTTRTFRQDSRSPGRDLNPGPPEYKGGMLTNLPWRSVSLINIHNKTIDYVRILVVMNQKVWSLATSTSRYRPHKVLQRTSNSKWSPWMTEMKCEGK
jgi:hypothetical protein